MPPPTDPPARHRAPAIEWLAATGRSVGRWAAATSWWRLLGLFIVVMIAAGMIGNLFDLEHPRPAKVRADDEKKAKSPKQVTTDAATGEILIGGPNGIRITGAARGKASAPDAPSGPSTTTASTATTATAPTPSAADASPVASAPDTAAVVAPPVPPIPPAAGEATGRRAIEIDIDEDDGERGGARVTVGERAFSVRGLIGDIGTALLILFFAYLVAAKVVFRKVAESNARVAESEVKVAKSEAVARSAADAAERATVERQLAQAKLQVLHAQVEPHFLFNTLAAVDYLIESDPPRASQMQKALIAYLRSAVPQMREEGSTLGREVKLVRSYLEIMQMRIEDRLQVGWDVPDGLESARFPPMMLQTLVENAIKHGIEPKPAGGRITVAARVRDGRLVVEVIDTGVGFVDPEGPKAATAGTGLGLDNIRERLGAMFPMGRARLEITSDPDTQTIVRIKVPYEVAQSAMDADVDPEPTPKTPRAQPATAAPGVPTPPTPPAPPAAS